MENSEKNRIKEIVNKAVSLFVVIIGLAIFAVSFYYNHTLEKQIEERDKLINDLTFSDNLVKEYFDVVRDSIQGTTSYILKESKRDVRTINTKTTIYSTEKLIETDTLLIENYNSLVGKYNALIGEFNNVYKKYAQTRDSLETNKIIIQLIKNNYPINVSIEDEKNKQRISINSEKLDSALILLPYFRDRLKLDNEGKVWTIDVGKTTNKK